MYSTIQIKNRKTGELKCIQTPIGTPLREALLANDISPYQGVFKNLNCKGMSICGSCVVKVKEGESFWERRSCQIRCFQNMEIELE